MDNDEANNLFNSYKQPASLTDEEASELFGSHRSDVSDPLGEPIQNVSDLGLGLAQGVTLGGADEAVAGLRALGSSLTGSDKSLADLYSEYKAIEDKRLAEAEERSPTLTTIGNVAGSIVPGFLTGGAGIAARAGLGLGKAIALKEAGKAGASALGKELLTRGLTSGVPTSLVSATEGALRSTEGKLINATQEEKEKLGAEAGSSGLLGGVLDTLLGGGASSTKKLLNTGADLISQPKTVQAFKTAARMSEEGVPILIPAEREAKKVGLRRVAHTEEVTNRMINADKGLGSKIRSAADKATDEGITLDLQDVPEKLREHIPGFKTINVPEEGMGPEGLQAVLENKRLLERSTPSELWDMTKRLDQKIDELELDPLKQEEMRTLISLKDTLSDKLKGIGSTGVGTKDEVVGEIGKAMNDFNRFRTLVPESLLSKGLDPTRTRKYLGSIHNKKGVLDEKVLQVLKDEILGGKATTESVKHRFFQGLEALEIENPEALKMMGIGEGLDFEDVAAFKKDFNKKGMEVGVLDLGLGTPYQGNQSVFGSIGNVVERTLPMTKEGAVVWGTGAGKALSTTPAKIAKAVGSTSVKLGKQAYNLDRAAYNLLGEALMKSENNTVKNLGDALKNSIETNDTAKRNAIIFSILQNPEARKHFTQEE